MPYMLLSKLRRLKDQESDDALVLVGLTLILVIITIGVGSAVLVWPVQDMEIAFCLVILIGVSVLLSIMAFMMDPRPTKRVVLASGLLILLSFGDVFGLLSGIFSVLLMLPPWFILVFLLIEEILYWLDDEKRPPTSSRLDFTLWKKGEAVLEIILGLGAIPYIVVIGEQASAIGGIFAAMGNGFWSFGLAIAASVLYILVAALIIVGFIYFNSLKYRGQRKL